MAKTVAITGANGFIGKALVNALHARGFKVIALVHHLPVDKIAGVDYHLYDLGSELNEDLFTGVEALIHLAFEFKEQRIAGVDINMRAAKALKALQLPHYIFLSSFAAVPPVTTSYYGQCKSQMEEVFEGDLIIRPGLVLGDGGLFKRMEGQLVKNRIVPLLAGGNQVMQTIAIGDLIQSIIYLMEVRARGVYHMAHAEKITYRQLMGEIAHKLHVKVVFIAIPVWMMRMVISALQLLPRPPISKDNLTGLLASKYVDTKADEAFVRQHWLSPAEALKALK